MFDWLSIFALIEVFPVKLNAISLGGVLVCFAALAALAIVFVWKFLPETKGLPVEEIVRIFEQQQQESVTVHGGHGRTARPGHNAPPSAAGRGGLRGVGLQAAGLALAVRGDPGDRIPCRPGRSLDKMAARSAGEPTAWPFTLVTTDPAVTPAVAAGLPQIVPMTRVPEFTGAIVDGTGRLASLV